jgi:hypothetical protein
MTVSVIEDPALRSELEYLGQKRSRSELEPRSSQGTAISHDRAYLLALQTFQDHDQRCGRPFIDGLHAAIPEAAMMTCKFSNK